MVAVCAQLQACAIRCCCASHLLLLLLLDAGHGGHTETCLSSPGFLCNLMMRTPVAPRAW